MISNTSAVQILKVEANSLHSRFIEAMKLLQESMEPSARRIHLEDLQELLERAEQLLHIDMLDSISRSKLQHMVARDLAQYKALAKYRDRKDLIVSSFVA